MTDIDQYLAEEHARVMAADWHDIPRGYYAIPVVEDDEPFRILGYQLFERKVPRTYKTGKTVGHDQWLCSRMLADGITWDEFREHLDFYGYDDNDYCRGADIALVLEFTDDFRAEFGNLTGRCGCCGKTLTDPNSKMRGIGPECIKGRP